MNEAKKKEFDSLQKIIKAIVIPYKHGATLMEIQKDYKEMEDMPLPYSRFGFNNPREFLLAMPDAIRQETNRNGDIVFKPIVDQDTAHILSMVSGQKPVPGKRGKKRNNDRSRSSWSSFPHPSRLKPAYRFPPSQQPKRPITGSNRNNWDNNSSNWDWPTSINENKSGQSNSQSNSQSSSQTVNSWQNQKPLQPLQPRQNNQRQQPSQPIQSKPDNQNQRPSQTFQPGNQNQRPSQTFQPNRVDKYIPSQVSQRTDNGVQDQPSQLSQFKPKGKHQESTHPGHSKPELKSDKPPKGPPNNVRASEPLLSASDIRNIRKILNEFYPDGVNLNFFQKLYSRRFGCELDPHARGFADLQHALSSISHICRVDLHPSRKFYIATMATGLLNQHKRHFSLNSERVSPPPVISNQPNNTPAASPKRTVHSLDRITIGGSAQDGYANNHDNKEILINQSHQNQLSDPINNVHNGESELIDQEDLDNFPDQAISNFKTILARHPKGISATNFHEAYEELASAPLEPTMWGYFSLIEVLYALPSVFFVDPPEARYGQASVDGHDEDDSIIYSVSNVPSDVRARVEQHRKNDSCAASIEKGINWQTKVKIMAILLKSPEGIFLNLFSTDYYINFKESLDPARFDYESFAEMFQALSKELPILVNRTYCGKDWKVTLRPNYLDNWFDLCIKKQQYEALKVLTSHQNVLLPGDTIPDVSLDPAQIDADQYVEIVITSVVNPNYIFINISDVYCSEALDELMIKLTYYKKLTPEVSEELSVPTYFLHPNLYCVALCDVDNCWHRVKILKVEPSRTRCKVAFIDIGGEAFIDSSKLRLMKKEFSYLPTQAIPVSLRGIKSAGDRWHSNTKQEILSFDHRASKEQQKVLCRLHSKKSLHLKDSIQYEVDLCYLSARGYEFLDKILIEKKFAIKYDGTASPSTQSNDDSKKTSKINSLVNGALLAPIRKPIRISSDTMRRTLKNLTKLEKLELGPKPSSESAPPKEMNGVSNNNNSEFETGETTSPSIDSVLKKLASIVI